MRILVPEAHAMGSIACIRSLGRAGHQVIGMSHHSDALGFRSRWCSEQLILPGNLSPEQECDYLLKIILSNRVDLVLPSEGLVAALGQRVIEIQHKLPAGPDPTKLLRYTRKYDLFNDFLNSTDSAVRDHLPPTALLQAGMNLEKILLDMELPLFAKFDSRVDRGLPARVIRFDTPVDVRSRLPPLLVNYGQAVLQSFVPGRGVGVFFLRWGGQVLATLMHRRLHEVPHTGGVSSLRETWWDQHLHADALRRIHAMDWWGVGMLEYRYSTPGQFHLMEFNARFWGSLHLALHAGVDFPKLLADAWSSRPVQTVTATSGTISRWTFPKEVEHCWSVVSDPTLPWTQKLRTCGEFVRLSLDPRVHSDLWFPGDTALYWEALRRTPSHFLHRR